MCKILQLVFPRMSDSSLIYANYSFMSVNGEWCWKCCTPKKILQLKSILRNIFFSYYWLPPSTKQNNEAYNTKVEYYTPFDSIGEIVQKEFLYATVFMFIYHFDLKRFQFPAFVNCSIFDKDFWPLLLYDNLVSVFLQA